MGQEGEGTGTEAQRKRTQRRAPGPTHMKGMPQQRDQQRPTPSGHRTTPGGARLQHTPRKHESDAVRTTPALAHQPSETTQGKDGTPKRGERATPTEKIVDNTAAQPTPTPSPPGGDPGQSKGHLTGTGRGRRRGHRTQGYRPGPPEDKGPKHRPPGKATPRTPTRPTRPSGTPRPQQHRPNEPPHT